MSDTRIAVIGLGYVGLPLALSLAKTFEVTGVDVDSRRVRSLREGIDENKEASHSDIKNTSMVFSDDPSYLKECDCLIISVPTPLGKNGRPDLTSLRSASRMVGRNLKEGALVVYESTVYPGATEDVCVPLIEEESGMGCGDGWKVAYSPQRVNPGDRENTLERITKIIAGMDEESLERVERVYSEVTNTYRAASIKVAEAAKVVENTQRDLNIALMNELSLISSRMGIDTSDVLEAARTKWNFLHFEPGLVGGNCIGVSPFYLAYAAERIGYTPEVLLAGRGVNDFMYRHVIQLLTKKLNGQSKAVKGSRIAILGVTFKENVRDTRNSQVYAMIHELERLGADLVIHDPFFDEVLVNGRPRKIVSFTDMHDLDAIVLAVPHDEYRTKSLSELKQKMKTPVIIDVKGILGKDDAVVRL